MKQATAIAHITKAIKQLISVLEIENTVLAKGEISALPKIVDNKVLALKGFNDAQDIVEDCHKEHGDFDQADVSMVKLKELFDKLAGLRRDNEVLLLSNLEVSDTIIQLYKKTKTEETLRQFGYNKDGKIDVADKMDKVMPSIGLNNKV